MSTPKSSLAKNLGSQPSFVLLCRQCRNVLTDQLVETNDNAFKGFKNPLVAIGRVYADSNEYVVHPDNSIGTRISDDPATSSGCCGEDGANGPNTCCQRCGSLLATEISDCVTELATRFVRSKVLLESATT